MSARTLGLLLILALACAGPACRTGRPGADVQSAPAPPESREALLSAAPSRTLPELTLHPSGGRPLTFAVEIAATPETRARGLMFRRELPSDHGMLFVFPEDGLWPFYMRNTYIPLDLIYIDAQGRVVGFLENLRPLDETERAIGRPARYVLEVNAHVVSQIGLRVGDRVTLPPLQAAQH